MKFNYTAVQVDGEVVKGIVEAPRQSDVVDFLFRNNMKPVSVSPVRWQNVSNLFSFHGSISNNDKIFITKYLALMLRAGTDLFKALDILIGDFKKATVKFFLTEIRNNLEKGQPFYLTFAQYPRIFSPIFINLVK